MNAAELDTLRAHLSAARAALDAGRPDDAAGHVAALLQLQPDLAETRRLEARLHLALDQPQKALAALDALDYNHPDLRHAPQTQFLRTRALLDARHDVSALSLLERLADAYPDDTRFHRLLAEACLRLGRTEQAIASLERVARLEPSDIAVRRRLIELLTDRDPQRAIDLLLRLPVSEADAPTVGRRLAQLLHRTGRWREAQAAYAGLCADAPGDAELHLEAGELADALGEDSQAVRELERAVAGGGSAATRALGALARGHMHAGRWAGAGRCWWRLTRGAPESVRAWAGLMVCAMAAGRNRLAQRARQRLQSAGQPGEQSRLAAQQWLEAAAGIEVARAQPESAAARTASPLQDLLTHNVRVLEQHRRQFPQRADTLYHLAMCLSAQGRRRQAAQAAGEALQLNPRYAAAGRLHDRLQRTWARAA